MRPAPTCYGAWVSGLAHLRNTAGPFREPPMPWSGDICGAGLPSWKPLRPKKTARHIFRESKFPARKHRPAVQEDKKAHTGVSAMQKKLWFLPLVVLGLILTFGCSKSSPPDDARIVTDVQSRFFADPNVQSKQIAVASKDGAVTLTGHVTSDRERMAAADDAGRAAGVRTVINDLQVSAPEQSQAQPDNDQAVAKPSAASAKPRAKRVNTSWYNQSPPAPWPYPPAPAASPLNAEGTTSAAAATPAAPEPRRVTIPAGTAVTVRLIDPIGSAVNRGVEGFHATLDSPLVQDGDVIVPTGYEVEGHLTEAQSAGRLSGHSQLGLTLDR